MNHIAPLAPIADSRRWQAVAARDPAFDGRFVFAVRTTGIFCRPSCSARQPRRENVEFFDGIEQARSAGYRACKKCRPDDGGMCERDLLRRACAMIDHAEETPRLSLIARALKLTPSQLTRLFQAGLGMSPRDYAAQRKLQRLRSSLKRGNGVADATYDAGFGSSSRVYERASASLGMTPATYRKGGEGAVISYAIASSPYGRLLVASTQRGICAVYLGDNDAFLEKELGNDFPAAAIARDDAALKARVASVLQRLDGRKPTQINAKDLPLDLRATTFQWRVWQALTEIPAGQTRSYGEIAARIGKPKAARAVGRACATNPVSIIVPCHRAVGSGGALTGYRWGVARKKKLLAEEAGRKAG